MIISPRSDPLWSYINADLYRLKVGQRGSLVISLHKTTGQMGLLKNICKGKFNWPGVSLLWPWQTGSVLQRTDTADRHRWWFHVFFYITFYEEPLCISSGLSSFILFYETPLCTSSGFCELAASSILSTQKTQRQLQSENFIISNLKMNFHHTSSQ